MRKIVGKLFAILLLPVVGLAYIVFSVIKTFILLVKELPYHVGS